MKHPREQLRFIGAKQAFLHSFGTDGCQCSKHGTDTLMYVCPWCSFRCVLLSFSADGRSFNGIRLSIISFSRRGKREDILTMTEEPGHKRAPRYQGIICGATQNDTKFYAFLICMISLALSLSFTVASYYISRCRF